MSDNQFKIKANQTEVATRCHEEDCNESKPICCQTYLLTKVYDWVKFKVDKDFPVIIPAADMIKINEALLAGHTLTSVAYLSPDAVHVKVADIDRNDSVNCPCVAFEKILTVKITITDDVTGEVLSQFSTLIQLFDRTTLTLPKPLDESNIVIKVTETEALVLGTVPFQGIITIGVSICQDIKVLLEVLAELDILCYTKSREGVQCTASVKCNAGSQYVPDCEECYPLTTGK